MVKTNPLSVEKIENLAKKVRENFNISLDCAFPIFEILDKMCVEGLLTIQYMEDDNPMFDDGAVAFYNPIDNFIYIKESLLEDIENNNYRANFTLAHEFFHFIQFKILGFEFEEVENCESFRNVEWQANEFAGQLLIPTSFLSLNDDELSEKFRVSIESVLTRKLYFQKRNKQKLG